MVTVLPGRNSCSTLSAARRATVPSANSSPEQDTMPTFRSGRLGMVSSFSRKIEVIELRRYFLGQNACQLLSFRV
jgi:hypothetical protein